MLQSCRISNSTLLQISLDPHQSRWSTGLKIDRPTSAKGTIPIVNSRPIWTRRKCASSVSSLRLIQRANFVAPLVFSREIPRADYCRALRIVARSNQAWLQVCRHLSHSYARKQCKSSMILNEFPHDYATAMRLLRPLAEAGLADAQYNLGIMYQAAPPVKYLNHLKIPALQPP